MKIRNGFVTNSSSSSFIVSFKDEYDVQHILDKEYWNSMIQFLPASYNQMRTCTLNYENLIGIYYARRNHKLDEWHRFCDWILTLPYAKELICVKEE